MELLNCKSLPGRKHMKTPHKTAPPFYPSRPEGFAAAFSHPFP
jgi:hypothetical protein